MAAIWGLMAPVSTSSSTRAYGILREGLECVTQPWHKQSPGSRRYCLTQRRSVILLTVICSTFLLRLGPQEKWYFKKKDPIAVLEADPDLIRRAEVGDWIGVRGWFRSRKQGR